MDTARALLPARACLDAGRPALGPWGPIRTMQHSTTAAALLLLALVPTAGAQQSVAWTEVLDLNGFDDFPQDVVADGAGNAYVAGAAGTESGSTSSDWYVQKISPAGTTLWSTTLDGFGLDDVPFAVCLGAGGEVYAAGWMTSPVFGRELAVARFDALGVHAWTRTFQGDSGPGEDVAFDLCVDAAGRVVAAGRATPPGGVQDAVLVAWEPDGDLAWDLLVDGSLAGDDQAFAVRPLPAGGVVFTAGLNSALLHTQDGGVGRVSASGALLWLTELSSGDPSGFEFLPALEVAANGDALVAGKWMAGGSGSLWVTARLAPDGTERWREFHAGAPSGGGDAAVVREADDGSVWVGGTVGTTTLSLAGAVVRYDPDGLQLSAESVEFEPEATVGLGLVLGDAGQAWLTGFTFNGEPYALFAAQFDAEGALNWKTRFTTTGSLGDDFRGAVGVPGVALGRDLLLISKSLQLASSSQDGLSVRMDLSESPQAYCTAKTASAGCEPAMVFTGISSAAQTGGFELRARGMLSQKFALFAYSVSGTAETPFAGGLLCLAGPVRRAPVGFTGGSAGADDCSGAHAMDWNAYAAGLLGGGPDPSLGLAGTTVHVQAWGRDTGFAPPNAVQLSNALRYVVLP